MIRCARGDRRRAVAFVAIDNQGMQVAYRNGLYGLLDIRRRASRATKIPASAIVAATVHSHAGPDLIGAWGFVAPWYLAQVRDGAVAALRRAARAARPVRVSVGSANGRALLHTQFDDPAIGSLDDPDAAVRVLRATDGRGRGVATLVAFAAHATVMGSRNTGASSDWPGALAARLESNRTRYGTVAVFEGAIGKTQPTVSDPPDAIARRPEMQRPGDPLDADGWKLRTYAAAVAARVAQATRSARALRDAHLGARTAVLRSVVTNQLLFGLVTSGTVPRAGAPWTQANAIATPVASVRVGDVLISGSPGESYPAVANRVIRGVRAREHFLLGLAGDQLGYHIAPASQYPVAQREAELNGNDNTLFNTSPQIGDEITQLLLQGARRLGFERR
jgi:hypothetical protein